MTDADRPAILALDTAFETASIFDVVVGARSIELVERPLPAPRSKRYPIADAFAPWASWDHAFVAEAGGAVVGFAAVEHEVWHARLTLWHFYVTRSHRGAGIGRALLARVETYGRSLGARRVWLETSNVNVPGIAVYAKLGYALCGADVTLYDATNAVDEQALFLSKRL